MRSAPCGEPLARIPEIYAVPLNKLLPPAKANMKAHWIEPNASSLNYSRPPSEIMTIAGIANRTNNADIASPPTILAANGAKNSMASLRSYSGGERPGTVAGLVGNAARNPERVAAAAAAMAGRSGFSLRMMPQRSSGAKPSLTAAPEVAAIPNIDMKPKFQPRIQRILAAPTNAAGMPAHTFSGIQ